MRCKVKTSRAQFRPTTNDNRENILNCSSKVNMLYTSQKRWHYDNSMMVARNNSKQYL